MVTVLVTATSDALMTLADLKEDLGTTSTGTDAAMQRFIERASARVARYTGRQLTVQRYQAFLPSYGGLTLQLPHRFIRTLFSVRDGTDTGQAVLSNTGYRFDADRGQLSRDEGFNWSAQYSHDINGDPAVGAEYPRWLVEYSAGFIPAGGKDSGSTWEGTTSTSSTVPPDLQEAVSLLAQRTWLQRARDPNIASERVGELSVSYREGGSVNESYNGMPSDIADILAPYRSII